MTEPLVIQIDWIYFLGIMGALIVIAWKSGSRFSAIETSITWIKESITKLEGRMNDAFANASPIALKPTGIKALEESGLKDWIDKNKGKLLMECETKNDIQNQYNIQECAFKLFDSVDFGDFNEKIKQSSFLYGWSIETMRRIGGIYFRDILLEKYNFKPEDLDKPDEKRN